MKLKDKWNYYKGLAMFVRDGVGPVWKQIRTTLAVAKEAADERLRQVSEEGYSTSHDDLYAAYELVYAACAYASHQPSKEILDRGPIGLRNLSSEPPLWWPWRAKYWKPRSHRENMVRAIALLMAEVERIDREQASG